MKRGESMPTISTFYGIIVRMFKEDDEKHNLPHIHAKYNEYEIAVSFNGEILEGKMPVKQLKFLQAWIAIHEEDLKVNWELLLNGEQSFKIDPLK